MNWRYIVMRILTGCGIALFMFGVHKFARADTIYCSSQCTVNLDVALQPFAFSVDDGLKIGLAILLIWAVGFGFRLAIQALRGGEAKDDSSE